jgi:hypothetical protein
MRGLDGLELGDDFDLMTGIAIGMILFRYAR